jgi:HYDIN/CFA65/VesB-like, Ig-like domain
MEQHGAIIDGSWEASKSLIFILFIGLVAGMAALSGCVGLTDPPGSFSVGSKLRRAQNSKPGQPAPGQLAVNPSSLAFGNVAVGSNSVLGIAFTNTSTSNVTFSNVSVAGPGFNANGLPAGLILAPGMSANINVTFSPSATGSVTGSVTVSSDAANSPTTIPVSGSGTQAAAHSVSLSWSPSASSVIGYNIYRSGSSAGPYAKLNLSVNAPTSFTDTTVQGGQTYYYEVTSVGTNNAESGFSDPVSASIPTP